MQVCGAVFVVKHIRERMELDDVKHAARLEKVSDGFAPTPQVGEPTQNAIGRVHDVKLAGQNVRQVIQIGSDKVGLDFQLLTQGLCQRNRLIRKIGAGHLRSAPGPR